MSEAAKIYARELVSQLNLRAPIDLVDVAMRLGLTIQYPRVSGFEGALVCSKRHKVGTILVKDSIRELGRRKFTIAHEIGHYVLPHHGNNESICSTKDVENWDKNVPEPEQEANIFAGELLVPMTLVDPSILKERPSFDAIRRLSDDFETSLTAAAYRTMQLTPHPAAIIWSTHGEIRWFKGSADFDAFIRVGERIAQGTFAHKCFEGISVSNELNEVRSELWLAPSHRPAPNYILEQSIRLPFYDSVLTLLCIEQN